jgi:hypothetical protein
MATLARNLKDFAIKLACNLERDNHLSLKTPSPTSYFVVRQLDIIVYRRSPSVFSLFHAKAD